VKLLYFFLAVRFRSPLARRFGENLNRVTSDFVSLKKCIADAAGDGHMRAQKRAADLAFILHNVLNGLNGTN
jgi:hypothetical protein